MRILRSILILAALFACSLPAHADFGNRFIANKRLPIPLDSSGKKLSFRFTCQENMSLSAAALYCVDALSSPAYLVSLQEDKDGFPSGNPLVSSTYVPRGQTWSTVPLGPLSLLKGSVYHLVVEHDALRGGGHPVGVIGPSNQASFLSTDVLNRLHPNDGSPDPQANTLLFENGGWKKLDQEPVYALYGTGSQLQGNPYDDPGSRPVYGQVQQGQVLHFQCRYRATGLALRVCKQGHPTSPLKFNLLIHDYRAHKCSPFYSSVALEPGKAPGDFQWVTIGIPPEIGSQLRAECWYFVFQTDGGQGSQDPPGCTDCYVISDVGSSGGLARASDLTFDGGAHLSRATCSMDGGDPFHWLDLFERDANVSAIGSDCPPSPAHEFTPISTPIPIGEEPRYEP